MNSTRKSKSTIRRLIEYAGPYWLEILGIAALNLLLTPVALLAPLPIKIIVDSVIGDGPCRRSSRV